MSKIVIYADGAAENNPVGESSAAAVLVQDGRVIKRYGKRLGIGSNNVAEYHALFLALRMVKDLGLGTVDIRMDSKLVVEQVLGRWKCGKADLVPLRNRAQELIDEFNFHEINLRWVPREENQLADDASKDSLLGLLEDVDGSTDDGSMPYSRDRFAVHQVIEATQPTLFEESDYVNLTVTSTNEVVELRNISKDFAESLSLAIASSPSTSGWETIVLGRKRPS